MGYKKNYYILARIKIFISILLKGKLSFKKILNAVHSFLAYYLKRKRTSRSPFMISFELSNECNVNCLFCRSVEGDIYDHNPKSDMPIPKGEMAFELYTDIIDQVQDYLIMAVLYVNGEPLLYNDLNKAIKYASDRRIATMISTNGMLLSKNTIIELLDSGLDFIKICISGFTQDVSRIQQRISNIEHVKDNIKTLVQLNRNGKYSLVIMVDFMLYEYNVHEVDVAHKFCRGLDIMFNLRPGNVYGLENIQPLPTKEAFDPLTTRCDLPWKILTVNWNGDLSPCCDYILWSGSRPYAVFEKGKTHIFDIWNGEEAIRKRLIHVQNGRKAIPVCSQCPRQGTAFKF